MEAYQKNELKPSGVEWIGDVPKHWEATRIKNLLESENNGIWGNEPQEDENDVFCVRVADFDRDFDCLSTENNTKRNISPNDYMRRELCVAIFLSKNREEVK